MEKFFAGISRIFLRFPSTPHLAKPMCMLHNILSKIQKNGFRNRKNVA